mmetsp:Transcript_8077/g.10349  ORF Transcript_8077/g.10349 Transcript_8077/m.10349 type:complete len:327 (+) Transcript_8077:34-1014(+)
MKQPRRTYLAIIAYTSLLTIFNTTHANSFEPYELNGGLVSAVAGQGYALIASDTRLSRGYEILSRRATGRIWRASAEDGPDICDVAKELTDAGKDGDGRDNDCLLVKNIFDGALIATCGCLADCDALKRYLQNDIAVHTSSSSASKYFASENFLTAKSINNVLGSMLYRRRSMPFYSFCVSAGLDEWSELGNVHVFDAIGSHERVAVAAAGSGREMLQPILDRLFSTSNLMEDDPHDFASIKRDGNSVDVQEQTQGLLLCPPVRTHVACEMKDAIELLVHGYRSAAERDINVGDEIIICAMEPCRGADDKTRGGKISIHKFPLKKH